MYEGIKHMTKKTLNVLIIIMVSFFVLFFAGSYAYEQYRIAESDRNAAQSWENDSGSLKDDNAAGQTNQESKPN